jgi:hypothetical protein
MFGTVTIPASGGIRKCSLKYKGEVLDRFLEEDLAGAPYLHAIGFAVGEERRVAKDQNFGTMAGRVPSYPLIEWGWDRQDCIDYIKEITGVTWLKSACGYCPFSRGCPEVVERWRNEPEAAAMAMEMEEQALRFNERMNLFVSKSVKSVVEADNNFVALSALTRRRKERKDWAVYLMRRVMLPKKLKGEDGKPNGKLDKTKRGRTERNIEVMFTGTEEECRKAFPVHATKASRFMKKDVTMDGDRAVLAERGETFPTYEAVIIVAPATAAAKTMNRTRFHNAWREAGLTWQADDLKNASSGQSAAPVEVDRATLNVKEETVLAALESAGELKLATLAAEAFPGEPKRASWTRNSLRKLARGGFVTRVKTGVYAAILPEAHAAAA